MRNGEVLEGGEQQGGIGRLDVLVYVRGCLFED